jgi:hypothetical protein
MSKPNQKYDDPEQSARFIALAQELDAHGSEASFKRKIQAIAHAPKTTREPLQPRKRKKPRR